MASPTSSVSIIARRRLRSPSRAKRRARSPSTLGRQNIYVWDGNYYALALMLKLDLENHGGAVRVGLGHYNTAEEVDQLLDALKKI